MRLGRGFPSGREIKPEGAGEGGERLEGSVGVGPGVWLGWAPRSGGNPGAQSKPLENSLEI